MENNKNDVRKAFGNWLDNSFQNVKYISQDFKNEYKNVVLNLPEMGKYEIKIQEALENNDEEAVVESLNTILFLISYKYDEQGGYTGISDDVAKKIVEEYSIRDATDCLYSESYYLDDIDYEEYFKDLDCDASLEDMVEHLWEVDYETYVREVKYCVLANEYNYVSENLLRMRNSNLFLKEFGLNNDYYVENCDGCWTLKDRGLLG